MSGLWDAADALLGVLWGVAGTGLIHGTALALITAVLAATMLRRARPALMAALWTIVLLKFLIPLGPELPVSISGLLDAMLAPAADTRGGMPVPAVMAMPAPGRSTGAVLWLVAQLVLWIGYGGLVLWMLDRRVRTQRTVRRWAAAQPRAGAPVLAVAAEAGAHLGLARIPDIRTSDMAAGPQVVGMWRPIVVVPAWLSGAELRAALLHELAHLRRRDTWVRGVQLLAGTLFWFWPVVRWVNRRIDAHREMACDQWAVACGPLDAPAYARMLLAFARRAARGPMASVTMGMVGERSQIERRVQSLLAGRSRPRLGLASGAAVAVWALLSLGTTSGAQAQSAAAECEIGPGLLARLLTHYPEADADGDGVLTREEVCAHQRRLQRMLDEGEGRVGWSGPASEQDGPREGGGATSAMERATFKDLWSSAGLPDCDACECGEPRGQRDTGGALVSMERTICPNQGESQ